MAEFCFRGRAKTRLFFSCAAKMSSSELPRPLAEKNSASSSGTEHWGSRATRAKDDRV